MNSFGYDILSFISPFIFNNLFGPPSIFDIFLCLGIRHDNGRQFGRPQRCRRIQFSPPTCPRGRRLNGHRDTRPNEVRAELVFVLHEEARCVYFLRHR
jgi:hypothetical protein